MFLKGLNAANLDVYTTEFFFLGGGGGGVAKTFLTTIVAKTVLAIVPG